MPTLFISYAYGRIHRAARKLRNRLKSLQVQSNNQPQEVASALRETKTTKTIGKCILSQNVKWTEIIQNQNDW